MRRALTGREVAGMLGVSPSTVRSWRARGQGPPFVQPAGPGTQAVYYADAIELFMDAWYNKEEE